MAQERFERNFNRVQRQRISLAHRANRGNMDALDQILGMTLRTGVYALLSVHQTVQNQDTWYERFLGGIPIEGLCYHREAAKNVAAWIASDFTLALLNDRTGHEFAMSAMLGVRGLGTAKSNFFAGLMGFTHTPCLDRHMCRDLGISKSEMGSWSSTVAGMARYRQTGESLGVTLTMHQWKRFHAISLASPKKVTQYFARTQHDLLFSSVLGNRALTAS